MKAEIKFTVEIIESERGWGQRIEGVEEFDTQQQADSYIKEYNKDNTGPVPDTYWYARRGPNKITEIK